MALLARNSGAATNKGQSPRACTHKREGMSASEEKADVLCSV